MQVKLLNTTGYHLLLVTQSAIAVANSKVHSYALVLLSGDRNSAKHLAQHRNVLAGTATITYSR